MHIGRPVFAGWCAEFHNAGRQKYLLAAEHSEFAVKDCVDYKECR